MFYSHTYTLKSRIHIWMDKLSRVLLIIFSGDFVFITCWIIKCMHFLCLCPYLAKSSQEIDSVLQICVNNLHVVQWEYWIYWQNLTQSIISTVWLALPWIVDLVDVYNIFIYIYKMFAQVCEIMLLLKKVTTLCSGHWSISK